jgi:pilus assembly protein CpaB
LSEHDAGFGASLDADWAEHIPLVGFGEEAGDLGDIAFVGFDEATAAPHRAGAADAARRRAAAIWQRIGAAARGAAATARRGALRIVSWLHYQFFGTSLRVQRSRNGTVILGAVLLSVGCGVVLRHWLPARPAGPLAKAVPVVPPPAPAKSVLVARQAIARGRVLTAADLRWSAWPATDIKQSYVRRGERRIPDLYGYVARRPIAEGEPIGSDSIVNPGKRGALAAALPPGMRAVSVDIREETADSGLVMPGDNVDLLLALPVPDATTDSSSYAVQTVLSNIRVLAIDQEIAGHDGRAIIGKTATLEVTPKEAEIVTLAGTMAQASGNLRLALRSLAQPNALESASGSPDKPGRSYLLESDISRLMPRRTDPATAPPPLTIVRRGQAATAQPSPAGS